MAEMEFVLNSLKEQVEDNPDIFSVIKDDVLKIFQELNYLIAFFKDEYRGQEEMSEIKKHFFRELRSIVNRAENVIDKFVIEAMLHQKKSTVTRVIKKVSHLTTVKQFATQLTDIMEKLKEMKRDAAFGLSSSRPYEEHSTQTGPHKLKTPPLTEEDEVVGFAEEMKTVIGRLLGGSEHLEAIPIVGMAGLGKTTLANMIFKNPKVTSHFDICIWLYVSQSYTRKGIFHSIIRQCTRDTGKYLYEDEGVLADELRKYLLGKRYLIVLDDIWTIEAFHDIKAVLPDDQKKSRALLTTRDRNLACHCNNDPHDLKFLSENECWELLQKKVFHGVECPPDLEELGRQIGRTCYGLPLATVLIAGALASAGRSKNEWRRVHQGVGELMISPEMIMELMHMSYDSLPFNLKACFLYCGIFPRGYDIPARRIVLLWIAEGFIVGPDQSTLEIIAENFLDDLVSKSLLIVTRRTFSGEIKTFRLHDMLHEFCTLEASEENLFKRIKLGIQQSFPRKQEVATFRRLCFDSSSAKEFILTKPYGEGVRSFLSFSSGTIMMPPDSLGTMAKSFPLIKVLNINSISSPVFTKLFFQLYHLRYIALSCDSLKVLPKPMEELWNLQTLIILTQEKVVHIKADICSMPRLRHFYINASANLLPSAPVKTNKQCVLQTLSTIEPESCTENMSARCQNLKKLGIRGEISELRGLFRNIKNLRFLEKLKLMNDHLAGHQELRLSLGDIFPWRLKELTLSGTRLGWNEMGRLARLEFLEVLKLKENSFTGDNWKSEGYVFTSLKVLSIERSDLVSWEVSDEPFPSLKKLVLKQLAMLGELPKELANIRNLQTIVLENMTRETVQSAKKIEHDSVCTGFNLTVFPPIP